MLLFTPGPTPVPESVRLAMATPTLHHRTPEFEAIFASARANLLKLFGMEEAVMLASSGTGAMQAAVVNICQKKALSINAGKFGERFGKIVESFGFESVVLEYEWNQPAQVEDIALILEKELDIDTVCIQVCESAGGLRHPVEEIAEYIKSQNRDIAVIADGITAVGVEYIDTANIDILIAGSQKALMLPPGLAMMGLSEYAIDRIGEGRDYYFNLSSEIKKQRKNTTAYTAATTLIIGLNAVFDEITKSGGLKQLYKDTKNRANATQKALESIGLQIYPYTPALAMSTIYDKDAEEIRKILKNSYQVNVAGGQDHLKGKIFRINQMGLIPPYQMSWVVNAVELALADLNRREYDGSANRVFNENYFGESKI